MIHFTRKQSITTLIVAIVLVLAAVGGFTLWKRNAAPKDPVAQNAALPGAEGGKYLVIPEWGVRFAVPAELRGDVYHKIWVNKLGGEGASFASKKLDALVGNGSCTFLPQPDGKTNGTGMTAALLRFNPDQPGEFSPEFFRTQGVLIKEVMQYEYYYPKQDSDPPASCVTDAHDDAARLEQAITSQLNEAFKSVEAIP